jgi:hypothetical protein
MVARGPRVVAETVVSPKEVALESLAYTASEVVGRDGSSPEPNHARRPTSGVAGVQLLEGTVSRRLVASGYPPKMLP